MGGVSKKTLGISEDDRFQILESRGRKRDEIKKQLEPKDGKLGQAFIDAYWDGRAVWQHVPRRRRGATPSVRASHISALASPSLRLTLSFPLGQARLVSRPAKTVAWPQWPSVS